MAVTIQIPAPLRPQCEGKDSVDVDGGTIKAALGALTAQYPDLTQRLYKAEGELNRFINVYVNDEDIRFLDNLDTAIKDGDEVSLVPAIAGG